MEAICEEGQPVWLESIESKCGTDGKVCMGQSESSW